MVKLPIEVTAMVRLTIRTAIKVIKLHTILLLVLTPIIVIQPMENVVFTQITQALRLDFHLQHSFSSY